MPLLSAWPSNPDFLRLFRGAAYRFEFGVRRGDLAWFQLPQGPDPALEARRLRLREHPDYYVPWSEPATPLLLEFAKMLGDDLGTLNLAEGRAAAIQLGGRWAPDWVLLQRDSVGEFRLVGACVASPSWWDPAEKLGLTVEAIHSPVPSLNAELGARIRTFLARLPADEVFARENWGLAAVPDPDLHPRLNRPKLGSDPTIDSVWLRVEHQAFRALPQTGGVAFVIGLTVHPLREVLREASVAAAFRQQMETMSPAIADYKGLTAARDALVRIATEAAGGVSESLA